MRDLGLRLVGFVFPPAATDGRLLLHRADVAAHDGGNISGFLRCLRIEYGTYFLSSRAEKLAQPVARYVLIFARARQLERELTTAYLAVTQSHC